MGSSIDHPEQADPSGSRSSTNGDDSDAERVSTPAGKLVPDREQVLNCDESVTCPGNLAPESRQADPSGSRSSTNGDDSDAERVSTPGRPKPWWEDDPEIAALTAQVQAEIYGRPERPEPHSPDPVLADCLSGNSVRELREARDDLARARTRYANAVHAGRVAGLSWAQIGVVLGVARQQLHRQFRDRADL